MIEQPFASDDQALKRGKKYRLKCRGCGARIEVFTGAHCTTVKEDDDHQISLFD
jgi:hypothetical protein